MSRLRNRDRVAALLAACCVSACVAQQGPPPSVNLTARQCAAAPDLGAATVLLYDPKDAKSAVTVIDDKAPCMADKPGAQSVYHAYALPAPGVPFLINIASSQWGDTIFAPRALFLGADGSVKRTTSAADFAFHGAMLSTNLRSHPDETWLVIASDPAIVGNSLSRVEENMTVTQTQYMTIYSGSDISTTHTFSHGGRVTVTITALPPPEPVKK